MFDALQQYIYDRRRSLVQSATVVGGMYALSTYMRERLEEVKDKVVRERVARESLRKRFQSTHDDACFTVMALIPTLATQILEDMDVEALTNELQSMSRNPRPRASLSPHAQLSSRSQSDAGSMSDAHSDSGSISLSSYSGSAYDGDRASTASGSWIEQMSPSERGQGSRDFLASSGRGLSDSITTATSSSSNNGNLDSPSVAASSVSSSGTRTKAQLWNEVKILALTRTLTTLYTTTLLALFTATQLTVLGRTRYITSVCLAERAERLSNYAPHFSLTGILAREAVAKIVDVEALWPTWITDYDEDEEEECDEVTEGVLEETEVRYLTLSWWILHVGWKDVAARVRGAVETVFDGISLRRELSLSELNGLVLDVRRRVEVEERNSGSRFLSSLLPPTPETTAHVLAQGGALSIPSFDIARDQIRSRESMIGANSPPPEPARDGLSPATAITVASPKPPLASFPTPPATQTHESAPSSCGSPSPSGVWKASDVNGVAQTLDSDVKFTSLLAETRTYLTGADFAYALTCALDRATGVLMDGLRARVFVDVEEAVNVPEGGPGPDGQGQRVWGTTEEVRIRLAGLLPGLARWSQLALNSTPNELVDNIMAVREVNALEAIIISDYEGRFGAAA
ncbi:Peroxin-3-domain-containing protein [Phlebopus sp. FC_14]|nr:Peroxin-3-domain-containing protein [Phlebopus sp. FC_14]